MWETSRSFKARCLSASSPTRIRRLPLTSKSITAGYVNPDSYRIESALDPLRGREDFKKLVAELEMKAKARPK